MHATLILARERELKYRRGITRLLLLPFFFRNGPRGSSEPNAGTKNLRFARGDDETRVIELGRGVTRTLRTARSLLS